MPCVPMSTGLMPAAFSAAITFSGVTFSTCGCLSLRNQRVTSLPICRACKCSRTKVVAPWACIRLLQCRRAADDFRNLLRDLRLPRPVVLARQLLDHVARVLGRGLHRDPACDLLADGRVEEAFEQADL